MVIVIIIVTCIFLLGAAIGSFINVLTFRLGTGLERRGRSFCFSCGKKLNWHELIPLWSFIVQKGKCRGCKTKISWQYPLVEFISGVLFIAIFFKFRDIGCPLDIRCPADFLTVGYILYTTYYILAFSLLLAISVYDFKHKIIPNQFVYPFIGLSFLSVFIIPNSSFLIHLFSGFLLALPFAFFWLVSKGRWMGFGDAKLALGIGWLIPLWQGVAALVLAFWIGAIASVVLLGISKVRFIKKRYTIKSEIPLGPFLALGTFLAYFFDLTFFDLQSLFIF